MSGPHGFRAAATADQSMGFSVEQQPNTQRRIPCVGSLSRRHAGRPLAPPVGCAHAQQPEVRQPVLWHKGGGQAPASQHKGCLHRLQAGWHPQRGHVQAWRTSRADVGPMPAGGVHALCPVPACGCDHGPRSGSVTGLLSPAASALWAPPQQACTLRVLSQVNPKGARAHL